MSKVNGVSEEGAFSEEDAIFRGEDDALGDEVNALNE